MAQHLDLRCVLLSDPSTDSCCWGSKLNPVSIRNEQRNRNRNWMCLRLGLMCARLCIARRRLRSLRPKAKAIAILILILSIVRTLPQPGILCARCRTTNVLASVRCRPQAEIFAPVAEDEYNAMPGTVRVACFLCLSSSKHHAVWIGNDCL